MGKVTLDVTTMGNVEQTHHTQQYEFTVPTNSGKKVTITAYGMERITGPISKLDNEVLKKLFPEYDPEVLQRKSNYVDVLLGCDYFGLHPKQEEARSGYNLSIMSGELGVCLQGTHPELIEGTRPDSNLAKVIHDVRVKVETYKVHFEAHPQFIMTPPQRCPAVRDEEPLNVTKGVHLVRDKREEIDKFVLVKNWVLKQLLVAVAVAAVNVRLRGTHTRLKRNKNLKLFVKIWSTMNPISAG